MNKFPISSIPSFKNKFVKEKFSKNSLYKKRIFTTTIREFLSIMYKGVLFPSRHASNKLYLWPALDPWTSVLQIHLVILKSSFGCKIKFADYGSIDLLLDPWMASYLSWFWAFNFIFSYTILTHHSSTLNHLKIHYIVIQLIQSMTK